MTGHHWIRRIGGALGMLLLCACVALFAGVTIVPRVFGIELRTVVSGSMEPAIQKGALVVASPVSPSDIRAGDVLMFRAPDGSGRVITHRVATIADHDGALAIQTRGDANNENDPWIVAPHDVLGRVRADVPHLGTLVDRVRSPIGFLALMVLPALIIVAGEASVWRRFFRDRGQAHAAPAGGPTTARPQPYQYPQLDPAWPPRAGESPRTPRSHAPSAFLLAATVMTLAATAVAVAMWVLAPRPAAPDTGARLTAEASSIAAHSATLANAEAFDGDIQVLRNAADPRLADPNTPPEDRATALRQMLLLNTNRFDAFALADLHGALLASTDAAPGPITQRAAYLQSAASSAVAMAAVAAQDGSVALDYAAPVRGTNGATIAILIGRANPQRLWTSTLATSIDGSVSFVVDNGGRAIAGATGAAPDGVVSGATAMIGATPSYCALAPIGRDTHLDLGWNVASCLPLSLAPASAPYPALRYAVDAVAIVLVVFSAALLLLAWLLGERDRAVRTAETSPSGLKAIEARLLAQREGPGPR